MSNIDNTLPDDIRHKIETDSEDFAEHNYTDPQRYSACESGYISGATEYAQLKVRLNSIADALERNKNYMTLGAYNEIKSFLDGSK